MLAGPLYSKPIIVLCYLIFTHLYHHRRRRRRHHHRHRFNDVLLGGE